MFGMQCSQDQDQNQGNVCWGFMSNCLETVSTGAGQLGNRVASAMEGPMPKIIAGGVAFVVIVTAMFSTAFTTCSEMTIYNDSNDIIPLWYEEPFGTKVTSSTLLPHMKVDVKFNGYNSYFNLYTYDYGTFHCNSNNECSLKDGHSNRDLKPQNPPIVFWNCYQKYVKTSSDSNSSTADAVIHDTVNATADYSQWVGSWNETLGNVAEFFNDEPTTVYLRGSHLIEEKEAKNDVKTAEKKTAFLSGFRHFFQPDAVVKGKEEASVERLSFQI